MSATQADDRVLRLERVIAASPERLFALWTEPEELVSGISSSVFLEEMIRLLKMESSSQGR